MADATNDAPTDGGPATGSASTATGAGRSASGFGAALLGAWQRLERRIARAMRRNVMTLTILAFFTLLSVVVLAPNIFINVHAGHIGVMWYRFFGGTVTEQTYGEGMHIIFPWDKMYVYDARLQNNARIYDTISSNGLSMQVEIAVRYRINARTGGLLHKLVGPNYPDILVYPEIGSHARELISRYTPEQLYTETRGFIQAEILERMVNQLGSSLANQSFGGQLVTVEDVLLRSVRLPQPVAEAIERKATQYQLMLEYDFRLAREEKERQRKRIEAEGVRDFQDIVARTITPEYLRLRGIEATLALSTSANSKTVIVGGRDGLPLILNTEDKSSGAPPPPTTVPVAGSAVDRDSNPMNARHEDGPPPTGGTVAPAPPLPHGPSERMAVVPLTDAKPRVLTEGEGATLPESRERVPSEAGPRPVPRDGAGAGADGMAGRAGAPAMGGAVPGRPPGQ